MSDKTRNDLPYNLIVSNVIKERRREKIIL